MAFTRIIITLVETEILACDEMSEFSLYKLVNVAPFLRIPSVILNQI